LKDRKFVQIDRDNFDEVMQKIGPELHFKVENKLQGDGSEMAVDLAFKSIEDFEPGRIAQQVEPLRKLLETRHKLNDLMAKVDRSEELEGILEKVLRNSEDLDRIAKELGGASTGAGAAGSEQPTEGGE
jgi:type VI secretion system protein ImpB